MGVLGEIKPLEHRHGGVESLRGGRIRWLARVTECGICHGLRQVRRRFEGVVSAARGSMAMLYAEDARHLRVTHHGSDT